jgi:hypothetical protein
LGVAWKLSAVSNVIKLRRHSASIVTARTLSPRGAMKQGNFVAGKLLS